MNYYNQNLPDYAKVVAILVLDQFSASNRKKPDGKSDSFLRIDQLINEPLQGVIAEEADG